MVYFMPCINHEEATREEDNYSEDGKRKKKKKYKILQYVEYAKRQALAKYSWNECISDQMKEYGNKETAAKVCSAIKNRTVKR